MRCFLAVDPDDAARAELVRVQAALRAAWAQAGGGAADPAGGRVTWSPVEQLHVTLQFLGDVADPAPVVAAARGALAGRGPLPLALGPLGTFGDRAPRVVWVGLDGPGLAGLVDLAGALARALAPLGLVPDHAAYTPHLTLARLRGEGGGPRGRGRGPRRAPDRGEAGRALAAAVAAAPRPAPAPFVAAEVVLYESRLAPPPPTYVPLARLPLVGAAAGPA